MSAPSAIAVGDVIHNGRAGKPIGAAGERREKVEAGEDGLSRTGTCGRKKALILQCLCGGGRCSVRPAVITEGRSLRQQSGTERRKERSAGLQP